MFIAGRFIKLPEKLPALGPWHMTLIREAGRPSLLRRPEAANIFQPKPTASIHIDARVTWEDVSALYVFNLRSLNLNVYWYN